MEAEDIRMRSSGLRFARRSHPLSTAAALNWSRAASRALYTVP